MGTKSELNVEKNDVVTHLFIDPADQDYILARMSYYGKMINSFFWSGGQAIEKYLKASLLLNGKSAKDYKHNKDYGHNLVELFEAVNEYASDLFPKRLTKPPQIKKTLWHTEETPVGFLERIAPYTDANSRYNMFGKNLNPEDLLHLDQFIFAARRVAFRLDAGVSRTVYENLARDPQYQPRTGQFLDTITKDSNHALYDLVLNYNFPFAPEGYEHKQNKQIQIKFYSSSLDTNPVLGMHIFSFLKRPKSSLDPDLCTKKADLADWVVKNITLPKDIKHNLCNVITCLRTRASASRSSSSFSKEDKNG